MTEKHYAHLAPNYVADTIRGSFPRLTGSTTPIVVPFGRSRTSRSKASWCMRKGQFDQNLQSAKFTMPQLPRAFSMQNRGCEQLAKWWWQRECPPIIKN